MKKLFLCFLSVLAMTTATTIFTACSKDDNEITTPETPEPANNEQGNGNGDDSGNGKSGNAPSENIGEDNTTDDVVTGGCQHLGFTTITLHGYVNNVYPSAMGIVYGTDKDLNNAQRANTNSFDSGSRRYTVTIDQLIPGTTYYYCAFIKIGDIEYKATGVYSFTTNSAVNLLAGMKPSEIGMTKVTFSATPTNKDLMTEMLNMNNTNYNNYNGPKSSMGVVLSKHKESVQDEKNIRYDGGELIEIIARFGSYFGPSMDRSYASYDPEKNRFVCGTEDLEIHTTYYYRTYTTIGGITVYGKLEQFTTQDIPVVMKVSSIEQPTYGTVRINFSVTDKAKLQELYSIFSQVQFYVYYSRNRADLEKGQLQDTYEDYKKAIYFMDDEHAYVELNHLELGATYYYIIDVSYNKDYTYSSSRMGGISQFTVNTMASLIQVSNIEQTGFNTMEVSFKITDKEKFAQISNEYDVYFSYATSQSEIGTTKSKSIKLTSSDSQGTIQLDNLSMGTTYYYCLQFIPTWGYYSYPSAQSEIKTFSTIDFDVIGTPSHNIRYWSSENSCMDDITGTWQSPLTIAEMEQKFNIQICIAYSTSSSYLQIKSGELDSRAEKNWIYQGTDGKTWRATLLDLEANKTYYYCTYIYGGGYSLNGYSITYLGKIKSFSTTQN